MEKTERVIVWAGVLSIFIVLFLGAAAAWRGADLLPQINAALAAAVCFWLLYLMVFKKQTAWRGSVLFLSFWLVFPLFKSIRQTWIHRVFDAELLALDRALWGSSLPEYCLRLENHFLSEIVSLGYLQFYFVVLFPVFWFSWKRHSSEARGFFLGLTLMYCAGFLGYLLIPAGGPFIAFPNIFPYPPEGGAITAFLVGLVAQGVTGMDVFPSLHCGVSLYVLGFFVLGYKRPGNRGYLFASLLLAVIFVPLVLATVYLRYHYGIDLIAGVLLAGFTLTLVQKYRFGALK